MGHNVHARPRYSNTLLVTLNNRIYFRDHTPPGHGDSGHLPKSGQLATVTSLGFAGAESQLQASTEDSFKLDTFSQTVDLEKQSADAASASSHPVCAFSRLKLLSDPMLLNRSVSLYNHLRNVIHFLRVVTGPSLPEAHKQGSGGREWIMTRLHDHCNGPWPL